MSNSFNIEKTVNEVIVKGIFEKVDSKLQPGKTAQINKEEAENLLPLLSKFFKSKNYTVTESPEGDLLVTKN